jgi:hypothetical protein
MMAGLTPSEVADSTAFELTRSVQYVSTALAACVALIRGRVPLSPSATSHSGVAFPLYGVALGRTPPSQLSST